MRYRVRVSTFCEQRDMPRVLVLLVQIDADWTYFLKRRPPGTEIYFIKSSSYITHSLSSYAPVYLLTVLWPRRVRDCSGPA
jgi:hypothetical protein